jgi:adenylate kinase
MLQDALDVGAVFNFICADKNQLADRLQRRALRDNRLDDVNLEVIKKRLAIYEKETKPILEYYGPKLVHSIDSTQTPINVLRDILRVLAKT